MKVFYSTAESQRDLVNTLKTTDQNRTAEQAERWLLRCKSEEQDDPAYWDRIRIFKVTIEEVPRAANGKPKSRKRAPEATRK